MNQLVSVTARADRDGITLIARHAAGWPRSRWAVLGGPIPLSADHLDEAAADALLTQMGRPRISPWAYDGACWTASVTRYRGPGHRIPVRVEQSAPKIWPRA